MSRPIISIIAAVDKNNALGKENKIPWNLPSDLKHFQNITKGHPVIMGRKTFDSIIDYLGRPLPHRTNIIVTRNETFKYKDCIISHAIRDAIRSALDIDPSEVFIVGGGELYKQGLTYADRIYLTKIDTEVKDADTHFPDYGEFKKVISEENHEEKGTKFSWVVLERE